MFFYSQDTDSLPITSTHIDIDVPCINSNRHRRAEPGKHEFQKLDIELEKYADCGVWEGTNEPMADEQYISADYSTSAYDLMETNDIFTSLERLPKYHDKVEELK